MVKKLKYGLIIAASTLGLSFTVPTVTAIAKNILKINNVNEKIFITFDANGGTLKGNKLLEFETNKEFKYLQNVPEVSRDGVITSPGWINASTQEVITENTTFTSSCTLKANWKLYNVTFNGNGGLIEGKETKSFNDVTVIHSDDIKAPIKDNYSFAGWKEEGSLDFITFPYKPTKNININACYTNEENITIAFAANGGKFNDGTFTGQTFAYTTVKFGTSWKEILNKDLLPFDDPVIEGDLCFSTWTINNEEIKEDYKFYSPTLIKANYVSCIQITFDVATNGGTWNDGSSASLVSSKIKLSNNPTLKDFKDTISYSIPKKGSVELLGWFDNKDANGEKLDLDDTTTPVTNTNSFTIYAYYKDVHNVTFTLNEGVKAKEEYSNNFIRKDDLKYEFIEQEGYTLTENQITVKFGDQAKTKGTDYTFTVAEGVGTLNINDAPGADIEIIINSQINTYSITKATLPAGVTSLDITGSGTFDEQITVSVDVSEGYTLSSIIMKNKKTEVETDITSTKKFKMPASDVEIIASTTINTYTITKDTSVAGLDTLEVSESSEYLGTVTVTATSKTGYTLNGIKIVKTDSPSTVHATISSGESFVMPYYNVTVIPDITINSYKLTLDANGGTLTASSEIDVTYNDSILNAMATKYITDPTHDDAAFKGWGESTSSQDIITNDAKMPASEKTIYAIWYKYNFEFIDVEHATITGTKQYNGLYKLSSSDFSTSTTITASEGYTFTGNYEIYIDEELTARLTTDFSSALKPGKLNNPVKKDTTVKIKPIISINNYKVSFNYNGGSITKDSSPLYFLNLDYGENILTNLNGVTATHDYQVFKEWQMIRADDGTTSTITSTTTVPASDITIKPIWKTANISLSATNGEITGTSTFNNKTIFYDREGFDITPTSGYEFHHYEYSFDNTNFTKIDSLPFKPFVTKTDLEDGATVYIKAVCVKYINLWLYANGGTFDGGTNYKCLNIIGGQKWKDIKGSLPSPTLEGSNFSKWVNYQTGADIGDDDIIDVTTILKAIYI